MSEEEKIRQQIQFWNMIELIEKWFKSLAEEYIERKKEEAYSKLLAFKFKKMIR